MPGRRPKPTALKRLTGNPGKRALNHNEPQTRSRRPKLPSHLGAVAQGEWKRLTRELRAMNLLASADADALAMYCQLYERWVDASKQLTDKGMVVETENGFPVLSPYLSIANQCIKQMLRILIEFGMTPASRSRIQLPEGQAHDPLEDFLQRRRQRQPDA